ncbi:MAG: alpha/beta hydrolase fold domain-containing protein [Saprospiraceae bacterium]|nr:alpha/beta hydrolase fold domain-containing protein [Saprospiraceae bacterium]
MSLKKLHILFVIYSFTSLALFAQPYTETAFPVYTEESIPYSSVTGFAGEQLELVLDLYKPVGDGNCKRPLLLMVHGGGFIAGSRKDADVVQICREMAARGYVTASIEYRLGSHPLSFYEPYALCNDAINPVGISKCIYMTDTLEFYRGMYRATHDLRGAIRFMKGRYEADSTDLDNVFIGGSSAGAITALHVALLDDETERPPHTGAIADAPAPDGDLASCVPSPGNRARPDLGGLEGELNLNGFDSKVKGVADFMGAVFNLGILQGETPPIYFYHRTDDLVVPANTDRLFGLYPYCLNPINLCQPLYTRPWVSGSDAIRAAMVTMGNTAYFDDILENYGPADGDDCLDDPTAHSIENTPLRCKNLSGFFASIIAASGNNPSSNCTSGTAEILRSNAVNLFPNPLTGSVLNLQCKDCPKGPVQLRLMDVQGNIVRETMSVSPVNYAWELGTIPKGLYLVQAITRQGSLTSKLVVK